MLNKAQLAAALKQADLDRITPFGTPTLAMVAEITAHANAYAEAIYDFVKGAQVMYQGGLTATADGDPVVGTLNHTIQ